MISLFRRSFRLVPAVFVVVLLFVLPASAYSDEPPVNPPFYGGVYICFMLFSRTDNLVVFVPTVCIFFCFCFALVRRLMGR